MTNNGSKKPEIASKSTLAPYEKVRSMTIERNAQRIRELGLDKIAQQLLEKNKNFAKGKENVNSNVDDQDYVPDEENCDLDEELEMSREATTSIPKKKARTREQPPRKNKKQPLYPSMAMENFLVAQNQMDPAEKTSLQNSENRLEQDNIHTTRPVSFAMKHEQLLRKDGVAPSKRKMFEETRRRKEGRTYDRPYDDTQQKIQTMRELEASQDDQSGEPVKDPFDEVMRNIRRGIELLQGLGVTRKKRKDKGPGTSLILPD